MPHEMNDDEKLKELEAVMENPPPMAPDAPPVPTGADRLYGAEVAGNKQRFYADLLRSFQSVLQGAAPQSGFKADPALAQSMEARAEQPMTMVKAQMAQEAAGKKEAREGEEFKMRKEEHATKQKESELRQDDFQIKLQKSQLDFQDMEANRDPGSPQSKIAQDRVLDVRRQMGQPLNEASVRQQSGESLFKTFDFLKEDLSNFYKNENARLERESREKIEGEKTKRESSRQEKLDVMEARRQKRQDLAETEAERRARQNEINTARGFMKDDPRFKKAMEQSMEFDSVESLIKQAESGNQQAVGALGTKLARAMGEVGVLTDTDVVRYVAGQSWGRKLKDWFTKGAQGELSPETIKGITGNLKELRTKLKGDVSQVYDSSASRMKAAYPDMDEKAIRGILGDPRFQEAEKMEAPKAGPMGETTERNGKKYKWNAEAGKYQLIGE